MLWIKIKLTLFNGIGVLIRGEGFPPVGLIIAPELGFTIEVGVTDKGFVNAVGATIVVLVLVGTIGFVTVGNGVIGLLCCTTGRTSSDKLFGLEIIGLVLEGSGETTAQLGGILTGTPWRTGRGVGAVVTKGTGDAVGFGTEDIMLSGRMFEDFILFSTGSPFSSWVSGKPLKIY